MITMIGVGIALLVMLAVVVGVVDAVRAPRRRLIAAERRERWEAACAPARNRTPAAAPASPPPGPR
jgi:hypothetical protein